MKRISFFITEEQQTFLQSLPELSVAEHIRRAIDGYINYFVNRASVSASKSRFKNKFERDMTQ